MATHLFVDTNVWLDFYRSSNDAGLSLLKHLQSISPQIIVTDQVEMEFRKHRQGEILKFIAKLFSGVKSKRGLPIKMK